MLQRRDAAAASATLAVLHAVPALSLYSGRLRALLGVRARLDNPRELALTFDDGPHPRGTPAVLELLREREVHATFFLVGEQVRRMPALASEIVAGGHEVGLHCDRHRNLLRLAPNAVWADLDRAAATIEDASGRSARTYRPPYGVLSAAAVGYARHRHLEPMLWSRWGRDWRARATPRSIAREVSEDLVGGDILLLHDADHYAARDSWQATVRALPRVLDAIEAGGLTAVQASARLARADCVDPPNREPKL